MRGNRCPVRPRENRHRRSPELRVPPDTAGDRISAVDLNPRGAHGFPSGGAGTRTVSYALTAVRRCRRPGMNGGSVGRLDKRADRQCRWRLRVRVPRTDLTGRAATALALAVASRGRCQMGVKHPELDARRSTLDAPLYRDRQFNQSQSASNTDETLSGFAGFQQVVGSETDRRCREAFHRHRNATATDEPRAAASIRAL